MREKHLAVDNVRFLSIETHTYTEEEIDIEIIDIV
jgi:hypothetical protein